MLIQIDTMLDNTAVRLLKQICRLSIYVAGILVRVLCIGKRTTPPAWHYKQLVFQLLLLVL